MSEKCDSCGRQTRKYMILGITQFHDINEDPEVTKFEDIIVCINCWYRTNEDLRIPKIIPPIREY